MTWFHELDSVQSPIVPKFHFQTHQGSWQKRGLLVSRLCTRDASRTVRKRLLSSEMLQSRELLERGCIIKGNIEGIKDSVFLCVGKVTPMWHHAPLRNLLFAFLDSHFSGNGEDTRRVGVDISKGIWLLAQVLQISIYNTALSINYQMLTSSQTNSGRPLPLKTQIDS